jgi:hypothetical protein
VELHFWSSKNAINLFRLQKDMNGKHEAIEITLNRIPKAAIAAVEACAAWTARRAHRPQVKSPWW